MDHKTDITHVENDVDFDPSDEKQPQARTIANIRVLGLSNEDADFYESYDPEARKALVRKIDVRLVPMLAALYLVSQLDRANIGNAKIEGLDKDLGMTGVQYNIALSMFFVPYVLLEVPSNIMLKKLGRPSLYIGAVVTAWGIIMMCHGFVKNFAALMGVRIILGALESGFFPAAVYLCSFWYMPRELAIRVAIFYCTSSLSGAFSGLLAAAIALMDGAGGYPGWAWIFILEGLGTIVLGILCFFCLIDSPKRSGRWLTPEEIRYLELQTVIKGGGFNTDNEKKSNAWKDLKAVATNPRVYGLSWILFCINACSYANKFALPTLTKAMGFSSTHAQLMTAPPFLGGALSALFFSWLSDKYYWRFPFVAIPMLMIAIGYSIIISFNGDLKGNVGGSMIAVIIGCMGIYPVQPACSTWNANNLAPEGRRAVGVAYAIALGNLGGLPGSYMFLDSEAPEYYRGYAMAIGFGLTGFMAACALEVSYVWGNKKKDALSLEDVRAKYSEDDLLRMGDKSPLFRYTT